MINGVDHIGIGVGNIDDSLRFYKDFLGFSNVIFDYTGSLPGLDKIVGKQNIEARMMMLAHENFSPVAQGMIKLVQLLPPSRPSRPNMKYEWGNICIAEVCMSVQNIEEVYKLATVEKGFKPVLPPTYALCPPGEECKFAYIRDPEGILIEFIEWHMYKEFGGTPRIEAVNHIGIGVRDMDKSMAFYRDILGFEEEVIGYTARMDSMAPMLPSPTPTMKVKIITSKYKGAWIEVYQHVEQYRPSIAIPRYGDIGHMEFAINVSNIEKVYDKLQKKGVKFICPPQKVDLPPSDEWKYTYMVDADGFLVSLVEH
jgi:catechol 2,3-dioxygenase-like lactoylglutathione lyase family enzyme